MDFLFALCEIKCYAYTVEDDTAFTLFYIKCQANETRRVPVPVLLSSSVRSRQSGIFNSLCTGIRSEEFVFPCESQLVIGNGSAEIWVRTTS